MTIYPNLNQKLIELGISIPDLAEHIGLNEVVVEKKMRGVLPWKLHEALRVCVLLNYSDVRLLFVQLDSIT